MSSKSFAGPRSSTSSAVPVVKPQCTLHPSAIVADKAHLIGPHKLGIGENTVVHPQARILAEHGNVSIGRNCIVAEKAILGPREARDGADLTIAEGVSIESGAVVEARSVGEHTTVEVKAKIGKGAVVGRWCKIAPSCRIEENEVLPDFTVVYGLGQRRVDTVLRDLKEMRDLRVKARDMEIGLLRTLIADGSLKWRT